MRGCRSATHPLLPAGLLLGGRRVQRSRYRPDPRRLPETLTALAGNGAEALLFATAAVDPANLDPANLYPSLSPSRMAPARAPTRARGRPRGRAGLADPPPPTAAPARPPACRGDRVIEFDRVTVTHAGATTPTIRDVTLNVGEGELCLVAGHTGTASRSSSARSTGSCRWSHRQRPASISPPATPALSTAREPRFCCTLTTRCRRGAEADEPRPTRRARRTGRGITGFRRGPLT